MHKLGRRDKFSFRRIPNDVEGMKEWKITLKPSQLVIVAAGKVQG